MKLLCTICARGGSQGVKNKNVRKLRGKPLIAHSLIQAKNANLFHKIAVSSDSALIRRVAEEWGADYVIDRPAEMATSTAPKLPVIQHAVAATEKFYGEQFDVIVDLDATSPLRSVEDIVNSVKMLLEHPEASNLVTAAPARRSPYFNMLQMNAQGYTEIVNKPNLIVVRRQDSPACYDMNASIYVWKRDALFNSPSVLMDKTILYVMPEERSIDIDSLLDWKIVNMLAKEREEF